MSPLIKKVVIYPVRLPGLVSEEAYRNSTHEFQCIFGGLNDWKIGWSLFQKLRQQEKVYIVFEKELLQLTVL